MHYSSSRQLRTETAMTTKAGLVIGCCLVLMGGWTARADTPHASSIKSNTMAPSGHPKKHYGAPIQKPILKHVPPMPKSKPAPQLKSTPLPEPAAAPKAGSDLGAGDTRRSG
jgi:hypothetical protein